MKKTTKLVVALAMLLASAAGCKKEDDTAAQTSNSGATASIGQILSVPIANRYIFVMNMTPQGASHTDRLNSVMSAVNNLLGGLNLPLLSLTDVYADALAGCVMNVTAAQAAEIAKNPMVRYYEQDQIIGYQPFNLLFTPPATMPAQVEEYGVRRTGKGDGTGKTAWIIDTGIELDHSDLNVDRNRSRSFSTSLSANDDNGHGTHVAGIVGAKNNSIGTVGEAYNATLVAIKVLAADGSGRSSDVIRGIDYTAANAAPGDAANISLGGGVSQATDDAVLGLARKGVLTAVAAGNAAASATTTSPARANGTNLYSVSACDASDNFASFSNFGTPVDFCEPGVNIRSTYTGNSYRVLSGTSMAAPHLCGLLLLRGGTPNIGGYVKGDKDNVPDPIGIR